MRDHVFVSDLRKLLKLKSESDLEFVFSPQARSMLEGSTPGWLYRAPPPSEKRQIVLEYCRGDSARNIAKRFKRGLSTVERVPQGIHRQ
jgi:hypothetical protein